jgi:hypothetical protein
METVEDDANECESILRACSPPAPPLITIQVLTLGIITNLMTY